MNYKGHTLKTEKYQNIRNKNNIFLLPKYETLKPFSIPISNL